MKETSGLRALQMQTLKTESVDPPPLGSIFWPKTPATLLETRLVLANLGKTHTMNTANTA